VYNFAELRRELEPHGHRFRGHSDTEVIPAAFEQWEIRDAVRRVVGMFAIAVWDRERRELSLIRDRMGKKPLYVYREPGLVTFGSELKALVAGPSFDRTIDRDALASYFRYLYVHAPKTIFRRAHKLPAAHILTVADANVPLPPPEPYWSLQAAARDGVNGYSLARKPMPSTSSLDCCAQRCIAGCGRMCLWAHCSRAASTRRRSSP
jgi:asparagine synthase (glutamine-hydrolysing)